MNTNKPTISVIVPTYKREQALCRMLESLYSQDMTGIEVILVDQTPRHEKSTQEYLDANKNKINIYFQKIPNLPMARNLGISHARGRYIIFCDDDVILPKNCINQLVRRLSSGEADGISGIVCFGISEEEAKQEFLEKYDNHHFNDKNDLLPVNYFIGAVMGFKKEIFRDIGGFDELFGVLSPSASGEDVEFCLRASRANYKLAIDTSIMIGHPLGVTGGCMAREDSSDAARKRHIQSNLYIEMKLAGRGGRIGILGWLRVLRGWVLNKSTVREGIMYIYSRMKELHSNYVETLDFYIRHYNS